MIRPIFISTIIYFASVVASNATPIVWSVADGGNGNAYDIIYQASGRPQTWGKYVDVSRGTTAEFNIWGRDVLVNGRITSINSQAHNDFLVRTFLTGKAHVNAYAFIGASRRDDAVTWKWEDTVGTPNVDYFNWKNGEPVVGKDYAAMILSGSDAGKWVSSTFIPTERFAVLVEYQVPTSVPLPYSGAALIAGMGGIYLIGRRRKNHSVIQ